MVAKKTLLAAVRDVEEVRYDQDMLARIQAAYEQGMTQAAIGRQEGVSGAYINFLLTKTDVVKRLPRDRTKSENKNGFTWQELAACRAVDEGRSYAIAVALYGNGRPAFTEAELKAIYRRYVNLGGSLGC